MTRLRTQFLRALSTSPRSTLVALRRYAHARQNATQLLRLHGLDEALMRLDVSTPAPISVSPTLITRLGESFSRTRRTCLDRALTRYAFLRSLGVEATFVIALDPTLTGDHQADALGHAWVEVQGEPWPFEDVRAYRVSYRHPAQRSLRHAPRPAQQAADDTSTSTSRSEIR